VRCNRNKSGAQRNYSSKDILSAIPCTAVLAVVAASASLQSSFAYRVLLSQDLQQIRRNSKDMSYTKKVNFTSLILLFG
jgi:anaerobic C4-dicarboxylate transporter